MKIIYFNKSILLLVIIFSIIKCSSEPNPYISFKEEELDLTLYNTYQEIKEYPGEPLKIYNALSELSLKNKTVRIFWDIKPHVVYYKGYSTSADLEPNVVVVVKKRINLESPIFQIVTKETMADYILRVNPYSTGEQNKNVFLLRQFDKYELIDNKTSVLLAENTYHLETVRVVDHEEYKKIIYLKWE